MATDIYIFVKSGEIKKCIKIIIIYIVFCSCLCLKILYRNMCNTGKRIASETLKIQSFYHIKKSIRIRNLITVFGIFC